MNVVWFVKRGFYREVNTIIRKTQLGIRLVFRQNADPASIPLYPYGAIKAMRLILGDCLYRLPEETMGIGRWERI